MIERRIFAVAMVALTVACVWPIFRAPFLPLVDLPAHAAQVALWQAMDAHPELRPQYTLHFASPSVGLYVLWRGIASLGFGVELAAKILVAFCVAGIPIGLLVLLRARERPQEWALAAFPIVYTQPLAWGFLPFCFTLALLPFALAAWSVWTRKGGWWRGAIVTALGLAMAWCHGLTAGFWGLACLLIALLEHRPLKSLIPLLPVGVLLAVWTFAASSHQPFDPDYQGHWWDWLGAFFLSVYDGFTDQLTAAAGIFPAFLAIAVIATIIKARDNDRPLVAASALALLLYLFLPFEMFGTFFVNARFAPIALLLFLASLPRIAWAPIRIVVVAGVVLTAGAVDLAFNRGCREFNAAIGDAHAVLAKLPADTSVEGTEGAELVPPMQLPVLDHFVAWAQLYTTGYVPSFTGLKQMLVQQSETPKARPTALMYYSKNQGGISFAFAPPSTPSLTSPR